MSIGKEKKRKNVNEDGGDGMKGVGNVFSTTRTRSRLSKSNLNPKVRALFATSIPPSRRPKSWGAGLALRGLGDSGCIFKIEVAPHR